ncbi:unnamed protein product [Bemisia tabaci]|uniref:Uncharacterized protein n=1 Tax=Bemisia tabaci TaxID=7038 RepID=A0A9P0AKA8_BEMTA|nr:unnamed protein product [Bemisia tabaci]
MENDPCLHELAHAEANCRRAAAAFNARPENDRRRCRFAVEPRCRLVEGAIQRRCSVKKIRPRSHLLCALFGSRHEAVPLAWCARPLFPDVQVGHPQVLVPPVVQIIH